MRTLFESYCDDCPFIEAETRIAYVEDRVFDTIIRCEKWEICERVAKICKEEEHETN